ncbi:methyltransferase domain-containing protein [Roseomonas aerophila]|uniref:Methyltransferase domain-containing protein n=1 Tax=Teichococcus aerophilus TaxID=1224513 RepID=A0ABR7RI61_9PROT|nr:SAM-dependent methyltransferase [Pseudoroseomonas aerophila]MBC9206254.1 methyltransferase domain-containing protein [Pseudoroseomonas aerophila]
MTSLPSAHFDAIYAEDPDPWRFRSSAYEQGKYAATLAALPRDRYRRGFEAACSVGVLTQMLAGRCDNLLATDAAAAPLQTAQELCGHAPHVRFRQGRIPEDWPDGPHDLIVLSEVLYYLDAADVQRVARQAAACLEPGGHVVLVHWLAAAEPPFPLRGDAASTLFITAAAPQLRVLAGHRTPQYRLDLLQRIEDSVLPR